MILGYLTLAKLTPKLEPPLAFNISHDSEAVAMAYIRGSYRDVGVDIMRVAPPRRETFREFVEMVGDTVRCY
jgi:4'-phosphopantetheinyl transferase